MIKSTFSPAHFQGRTCKGVAYQMLRIWQPSPACFTGVGVRMLLDFVERWNSKARLRSVELNWLL